MILSLEAEKEKKWEKISPFPAKGFAHHLQPYEFPFKVIDRNQFGNRIYASVNKTQLIFRKKIPNI